MRTLVLVVVLVVGVAGRASAMELGVQDQGADPGTLERVARGLGATTIRVIASPSDPASSLVAQYKQAGFRVQAAIVVKRWTTVGAIRGVIRSWHGNVRTVSIGNEPELNGIPACTYARLFRRASAMIRWEFPGMRIGFGEFSPALPFEYIQKIARCKGARRIRADFTGVHPYQFFSDPLGAPTEKSGVGTWLGLGNLGSFRRAARQALLPTRLRATEFSYLLSGPYKIPLDRATAYWPRAIKQAQRNVQQLVVYGLGEVHDRSTWGSASLLDRFGNATPALRSLARALGRVWPADPVPPPAPAGDLITPLPGPPKPPTPPVVEQAVSTPDASGAGSDTPEPVEAPQEPAETPETSDPDPSPVDSESGEPPTSDRVAGSALG